jgi:DNA-binding NtrC family response regulator
VIHIHMPPLRERMEDVPLLVEHFLTKFRHKAEAIPTTISEEAMARLMEHDWPGNVRELENAVERAVVLSRGNTIMPDHLPLADAPVAAGGRARTKRATEDVDVGAEDAAAANGAAKGSGTSANGNGAAGNGAAGTFAAGTFKHQVESLEKQLIQEALQRHKGNRSKAAEELGIYRRLLYAKMREYGIGE